jgi:DNA gyrase/topoisomerase IV subunit B
MIDTTALTNNGKLLNTRQFYDKYFTKTISFPTDEIDAVVGFFLKREFDIDSARSTAIVLLTQARTDNVNVFTLLDTLKGLPEIQLSQLVAQVLNANRDKTSVLGYRIQPIADNYETRNILV